MKTIGFIDHHIDEYHANNYPNWIRQSAFRDAFDVVLACEETTPEGKMSIDRWCAHQGVQKATGIAQVVDRCDCIVVLSPDNPERHEDLADLPLGSGKPVYIDKPIAPTLAAAQRLFEKAHSHSTPMMSCSALRFTPALQDGLTEKVAGQGVHFVSTRGGGSSFDLYAIHQLEMLVMLLGTGAEKVMQCGNQYAHLMLIHYPDGRRGAINLIDGHPFQLSAQYDDDKCLTIDTMDDFYPPFIEAMLKFFETGVSPIPEEQTLEIAALIEAGTAALQAPYQWVKVP